MDLARPAGMKYALLVVVSALLGPGCFQFPGAPSIEPDAGDAAAASADAADASDGLDVPEVKEDTVEVSQAQPCVVTRREVGCEQFEERLTFDESGALVTREVAGCGTDEVVRLTVERDDAGRLVALDEERSVGGGPFEPSLERRFERDELGRLVGFTRTSLPKGQDGDISATLGWNAEGRLEVIEVGLVVDGEPAHYDGGGAYFEGDRLDETRFDTDGGGGNDSHMAFEYGSKLAQHVCDHGPSDPWSQLPCEGWALPLNASWDPFMAPVSWTLEHVLDKKGQLVGRVETAGKVTTTETFDGQGVVVSIETDDDSDGVADLVRTIDTDAQGFPIAIETVAPPASSGSTREFEVERSAACSGAEIDPLSRWRARPWHPLWHPLGGRWLTH